MEMVDHPRSNVRIPDVGREMVLGLCDEHVFVRNRELAQGLHPRLDGWGSAPPPHPAYPRS